MVPIRALVVGAGETSKLLHLPELAALAGAGRLELVDVCDLSAARAAHAQQTFGFARASGDAIAAIQARDIDAVYLFGDAQMHHGLGMAALSAGKHLFVEKPIAPSHAQALELAAAAKRRGLVAVGGHNRRFYRALTEIKARGGKAGWRHGEAVFHKPIGAPAPFGAKTWLTANGIHALDALLFIMGGQPEHLAAAAHGETFSALLRWPDGAQGVFLCDNRAGGRRETYAFQAPGESCTVEEDGLRISSAGQTQFISMSMTGDGFAAEHAAFMSAVEQNAEPLNSLAVLAPSLKVAELIEAGFNGRIEWPTQRPIVRVVARPQGAIEGSILVVNAASLAPVLGSALSGCRLAPFDDVAASPHMRPDIVAALLGTGSQVMSADFLARLPNLKVAGLVGLSFARHRPELLAERGIVLVNANAAYAESVADFAFSLAVLARRRAFVSHQVMRRGGWGVSAPPEGWRGALVAAARTLRPALGRMGLEPALLGAWRKTRPLHGVGAQAGSPSRDLGGAQIGLVGWGANAQAFAARLIRVDARVLVFSENASPESIVDAGAQPASLSDVLAADIVSLHRGLTPQTRYGLGAMELARLRPGAVLINVARAELIEPKALTARLRRGDIFACLDVFENEPPAAHDRLRRLPNVFLTSHIAGGSKDTQAAATREVIGKIERHLAGAPAPAVSRERLRTMT